MYCFWKKNIPGKEKKYVAHLHKQLKPATYFKRFRVSRVIAFAFGFDGVSEFNICYFKWLPAVRKPQSLISKWKFDSNTAIPLQMKFIPKLWAERADQKHVNSRSR